MFRSSYRPSLLFALLLLASSMYARWQASVSTPTIDFFILWGVPRALSITPVSSIYTAEGQREMASVLTRDAASPATSAKQKRATELESGLSQNGLDSPGSPFLYAAVGLLSTGDYEIDQRNFAIVCLLCFGFSIVLLCRLLRFSDVETILLLVILSSSYVPTMSDIAVGNINQIQLSVIALFIFFMSRSQWLLAGIAIGTGMALKPNIAIVFVLSMLLCLVDRAFRRQWRLSLGAAAAMLLCMAISSGYFGTPSIWSAFARNLPSILNLSYPLEQGNFGLSMLLFNSTERHVSVFIALILVAAFVCAVFMTRNDGFDGRRRHTGSDAINGEIDLHQAFAVAGVGCAVMLLSSNLVWLHYYVLLIPMSLYLMRPLGDNDQQPSHSYRRVLAIVALLMLSAGTIVHDVFYYAVMINSATSLMLALTFYEIWCQRNTSAAWSPSKRTRSTVSTDGSRRRRLR